MTESTPAQTTPDNPAPAHGCMIDGQPAMPILISEYNMLVAQVAEAEAAARRALEQRQQMAEERYIWQQRGDRAEAAIARVTAVRDQWQGRLLPSPAYELLTELRAALDEPGPAATQATEPASWLHAGTRDLSIPDTTKEN